MAEPIVRDLVIILGASIVVVMTCLRFRLPASVGFLITGIVSGPRGLGLIKAEQEVEILAEIGIALLLFAVGIEFSLKRFFKSMRQVLIGGALQVFLTILGGFIVALLLQRGYSEALFFGGMLSLSSTAIVSKILQERDELKTPHGRVALSILIFQDIIVVFMVVLLPLLAKDQSLDQTQFWWPFFKATSILTATLISAYWIVPRLLFETARTRSSTLFVFVGLFLCLAVSLLTSYLGLSLALGAFLSGLVISESEYGHQVQSHILPFQEILTSFFFLSVGMLLDASFLVEHPFLVLLGVLGVMLLKSWLAGLTAIILGFPLRTAILTGLILSQVGEFSFLLAKSGLELGFTGPFNFQLFLAVTLLTMALTPFIPAFAPKIVDILLRLSWPQKLLVGFSSHGEEPPSLESDNVLLVGFGKSGKNIAKALKSCDIRYLALDINPELVRKEKQNGEPVFYGDATHESALSRMHVSRVETAAIMVDDLTAAQRIVATIRHINPRVSILVRANRMLDKDILTQLGANQVITDEFEVSVQVIHCILTKYQIEKREINKCIREIRTENANISSF